MHKNRNKMLKFWCLQVLYWASAWSEILGVWKFCSESQNVFKLGISIGRFFETSVFGIDIHIIGEVLVHSKCPIQNYKTEYADAN